MRQSQAVTEDRFGNHADGGAGGAGWSVGSIQVEQSDVIPAAGLGAGRWDRPSGDAVRAATTDGCVVPLNAGSGGRSHLKLSPASVSAQGEGDEELGAGD